MSQVFSSLVSDFVPDYIFRDVYIVNSCAIQRVWSNLEQKTSLFAVQEKINVMSPSVQGSGRFFSNPLYKIRVSQAWISSLWTKHLTRCGYPSLSWDFRAKGTDVNMKLMLPTVLWVIKPFTVSHYPWNCGMKQLDFRKEERLTGNTQECWF